VNRLRHHFLLAGLFPLLLAWPSDHLGWILQSQTNPASAGLGANWITIQSSTATNRVTIPINLTKGSVFFRLVGP
jgi:hypothetical protein